MTDKPNLKDDMKENLAFAAIKGVFIGAIAGRIGISISNLLTSNFDKSEDQTFANKFKDRSKQNMPFAAIIGGIAGAVYYHKSAKDYNKSVEEKWTIKVSQEDEITKNLSLIHI